jgi:hypothetical protein
VYDIYAGVQGRDLGSISDDVGKVVAELQKALKPGNAIQVLGQIQSMRDAFSDLSIGLLFAAVFVYLLMVVNYQNFGDPFVVILALPATLCGIVTMLFITGTTLSVPPLMGAIMAVGVASANSILLVTFAREQQLNGRTRVPGRHQCRPNPHPTRADDGSRDDRHGDRRRRRGTECGACARGDRRPLVRDSHHCSSSRISLPCCASATTALRLMAYSRISPMNDLNFGRDIANPPKHRRQVRRRWGGRLFALGGFLLLAGGLSLGTWAHDRQQQQVTATAQQEHDFVPSLRVATVEPSRGIMSVTLPGTTAAFAAANIYARATGYIAKRNVDIGSRVKAGDLLVEITAPELDHQIEQGEGTLAQMQASLEQARANRDLAQVTWDRDNPLV